MSPHAITKARVSVRSCRLVGIAKYSPHSASSPLPGGRNVRREPSILRLPTAAKIVRTNTRFRGSASTSSSPMRVSMSQLRSLFSSSSLPSTCSRDLLGLGNAKVTAADTRRRKNRTAGDLARYTRDTIKTHPTKNEETVRLWSCYLVGIIRNYMAV